MFGYNIGFNIDGEDYHRTCAGTCASLLIFAWIGLIIHYLLNQLIFLQLDRPLTTTTNSNFYLNKPISLSDGFKFAVGVSNPKNFTYVDKLSDVDLV